MFQKIAIAALALAVLFAAVPAKAGIRYGDDLSQAGKFALNINTGR